MKPLDSQVFNRLTRLYIIALTTVAVLSMSGQLVIQLFLRQLLDDSHVVNIAGRQRMLSQRLSKTAILLCRRNIYQADAEHYSQDIKDIVKLWKQSHDGLRNGHLDIDGAVYEARNSAKIDSMFNRIEPTFLLMYNNALIISEQIEHPAVNKDEALQAALKHILANERSFLKQMDKIVFQYDVETTQRVDNIKRTELILFVLLFIVLLLEGILIFRPIAIYIREVIKKITDSEQALRQTNDTLIKTQEALVQATAEKYKLQLAEEKVRSASLMEGQEVERKRLARELHDGIGQMLTGLRLHGEKVKSFLFANEKQEKSFLELQKLIIETIEATRTVSFNLAPSVLSDYGVSPAIRILTEQVSKASNIEIEFVEIKIKRLPEGIETCLYRICQEALHNAIKYSEATKIKIQLSISENYVNLLIDDDGKGFDLSNLKKGLTGSGLKNMQTRAELLNGQWKLQTKPEQGTKVMVRIPLAPDKKISKVKRKKEIA